MGNSKWKKLKIGETWPQTFPFVSEITGIRWKLSNRFKFSHALDMHAYVCVHCTASVKAGGWARVQVVSDSLFSLIHHSF